jgi:hypothetical protein
MPLLENAMLLLLVSFLGPALAEDNWERMRTLVEVSP